MHLFCFFCMQLLGNHELEDSFGSQLPNRKAKDGRGILKGWEKSHLELWCRGSRSWIAYSDHTSCCKMCLPSTVEAVCLSWSLIKKKKRNCTMNANSLQKKNNTCGFPCSLKIVLLDILFCLLLSSNPILTIGIQAEFQTDSKYSKCT